MQECIGVCCYSEDSEPLKWLFVKDGGPVKLISTFTGWNANKARSVN